MILMRTREEKVATIEFYNTNAQRYAENCTPPRDASIKMFAGFLKDKKRVLDLGCGPGTDMVAMRSAGLEPVGIDAALSMCDLARNEGFVVRCADFENMVHFRTEYFDGIWARNSLLHSPPTVLPKILRELSYITTPNGVLFVSMKESKSDNIEEEVKQSPFGFTYYCYWPVWDLEAVARSAGFHVFSVGWVGNDSFGERQVVEFFARKKE